MLTLAWIASDMLMPHTVAHTLLRGYTPIMHAALALVLFAFVSLQQRPPRNGLVVFGVRALRPYLALADHSTSSTPSEIWMQIDKE